MEESIWHDIENEDQVYEKLGVYANLWHEDFQRKAHEENAVLKDKYFGGTKMATKRGCKKRGRSSPRKRGGKCGPRLKGRRRRRR